MANRHPLILSHPSTLHTLESFRIQRHFSAKKNRTWLLGSHQRLGGECHRLRVVGLDVNVDMTWRRRRGGFREAKKQRHRKRQSKIPPKKQNAAKKCSKDLEINMFRYLELGRIFLGPAQRNRLFVLRSTVNGFQWMNFQGLAIWLGPELLDKLLNLLHQNCTFEGPKVCFLYLITYIIEN